jgi:Lon protease-like protein
MVAEVVIPLFPLGVVLLPEMPLPLHIFEERYKLMIGECLEDDREFGIVYFDGTQVKNVGCTARILKVMRRYDDGKIDIMTIGEKRFYIREIHETKAYLEATIVYFDDDSTQADTGIAELAEEGIRLLKQVNLLSGKQGDSFVVDASNHKVLSFLIPSSEGFTLGEKQEFLEMTSSYERLKKGIKLLRKAIERIKITREIKNLIGGNGHIRRYLSGLNRP